MVKPIGPYCRTVKIEFFEADGTPAGSYSGELRDYPIIRQSVDWWNVYEMTLNFVRLPRPEDDEDFDPDGYWLH